MADKRTVFDITADTWVKVIDGATAAKIYQKKTSVTYYSMVGTAGTDIPADTEPANLPTAERMGFDQFDNHFVSDSSAVYMWVRCSPGETGQLTVTL